MNHTLKVIAISLAAFAIYLPIAYRIGRDFIPVPIPDGAVIEPLLRIDKGPGFSYRAQSTTLAKYSDDSEDKMRSLVMLYEDMTLLGPAMSYVRDVQRSGRGRFNFVKFEGDPRSFINFSTSDNSDPRTNGRRYWIVLPKPFEQSNDEKQLGR